MYIRACFSEPHRPLYASTPSRHVANVRGIEPHRPPHSTAGGRGNKEENCNAPGPSRRTITPSGSPSPYQQLHKGPLPENGTYRNTTAPQPSPASASRKPKSQPHRSSNPNRPSGQNHCTNSQPNGGAKERNGRLTGGPETKREPKGGMEQGARLEGEAGRSGTVQSQGERPGKSKKSNKKRKRGKKKGTRSETNTSLDTGDTSTTSRPTI